MQKLALYKSNTLNNPGVLKIKKMKKGNIKNNTTSTDNHNSLSCIKCGTTFPSEFYKHYQGGRGFNCIIIGDYTAIPKWKINVN